MADRRISRDMREKLHEKFVSQYRLYRDAVLSGERVAGRLEKEMVMRQEKDLARSDFRWHFDWRKATAPLIWFSGNLKFPSGPSKGKALRLEPWQVWIVMVLFGWVNDDGNRRYVDAYLEVARKNGKSTWAGAVLNYLAFASGEMNGNPCYIAATSLDQAGECFTRAADELKDPDARKYDSKNNKVISCNGNSIIALAGEPKDGKLCHGAVIDEYHEHKSNDLINSIVSGNVADPNVLVMRITTAGTLLQGVCKQEHDKGVKVLDGTVAMDRYFFAIFTIDDTDSADDPRCWEKANPNYGVSVDRDLMMNRYEVSKVSQSEMVVFKTKNLNIWVNSLARWTNMTLWNEKCCFPFDPEELEGRTCYGGLDLSHNSDFTCLCLDFPMEDGTHRQLYWYFIPENRVMDLERQLYVPVSQWVHDSYIVATPGDIIDYEVVAQVITQCRERFDLVLVGVDRWHLEILDQHMPSWWESLSVEFSQGWKQMSSATNQFERAYMTGRIQSGGNPVQRWQMSCAESKTDTNGNIKIVKPNIAKSSQRIDGVIASIMAYDTALSQIGEPSEGLEGDISSLVMVF